MVKRVKDFFFREHTSAKKVVTKNFMWLAISQVGSRFIKAFVTVYAARTLGAAGYGIFSYALALSGFFVFFKNIGVDAILTREIAKKPENEHAFIATSFWIEFALLAITALLMLFIAPLFSGVKEAVILLPLVAVMLVFDDLRDMSVAYFRGKEEMQFEALVIVVGNISVAALGFAALLISPTPFSFMLAYAGSSAIGWTVSFLLFRRRTVLFLKRFQRKLVVPILKSAWPMAVGGTVGMFLFGVDTIMLGRWRSISEVGLYAAAQKLVGILGLFPSLFSTSIFPFLSRAAEGGGEQKRRTIENAMSALFLIAIPLTIGGWIVGDPLVSFIFGPGFEAATPVFTILLPSILATYPPAILFGFIFAHNKQVKIIPFVAIASITNVVLNFFLIREFGSMGAAAATLTTNIVFTALLWNYAKSITLFKVLPRLFKMILASILMGGFTFLMHKIMVHVMVTIFTSALLYFWILYCAKDEIVRDAISLIFPKLSAKK